LKTTLLKKKLKKASISIGFFLLIIFISYMASTGVETPMKDGKVLSENGSRWVGTGILVFYILFIIAIVLMFLSGLRKMLKK
jgi:ABC-type microcin C transport system permease subunit YejB